MVMSFLPTPDEIAAQCAEIRNGWSETERRLRLRSDCRTKLFRAYRLREQERAAKRRQVTAAFQK